MNLFRPDSRAILSFILAVSGALILVSLFAIMMAMSPTLALPKKVGEVAMFTQVVVALVLAMLGLLLRHSRPTRAEMLLGMRMTIEQEERVRRAWASLVEKRVTFRELPAATKFVYCFVMIVCAVASAFGVRAFMVYPDIPWRAGGEIHVISHHALGAFAFFVTLVIAWAFHGLFMEGYVDRYDEMRKEIFREFGIK